MTEKPAGITAMTRAYAPGEPAMTDDDHHSGDCPPHARLKLVYPINQ